MDARYFSKKIVGWYRTNKRDLPWRHTKDPYKIWLSEVILQQTRVVQGMPYYLAFVKKYPSVATLAKATEQEVLRLWQGLGYYSRARNLHKCAKTVVSEYKGVFPKDYEQLRGLPGIGDYTAAAIASFSNGEPVAVVDGNVFRVLSRIVGVDVPINSLDGKKHFTILANELLDRENASEHNQAIMEFGALHCTPKDPKCESCIFNGSCVAFKSELWDKLPVKLKNKKSKKRYFYYLVRESSGKLMMRKRTSNDIWKGLYDFELHETKRTKTAENVLKEANINPSEYKVSGPYKHVLTHQTIYARFIILKDESENTSADFKAYTLKKIHALPKPVLISRFLADHYGL